MVSAFGIRVSITLSLLRERSIPQRTARRSYRPPARFFSGLGSRFSVGLRRVQRPVPLVASQDPLHVPAGLGVRDILHELHLVRNTETLDPALHRLLPRVVRRQGQAEVSAEFPEQIGQMMHADPDVDLRRLQRGRGNGRQLVLARGQVGGLGHELHQPARAGPGDGARGEGALFPDQTEHQVGVEAALRGVRSDQVEVARRIDALPESGDRQLAALLGKQRPKDAPADPDGLVVAPEIEEGVAGLGQPDPLFGPAPHLLAPFLDRLVGEAEAAQRPRLLGVEPVRRAPAAWVAMPAERVWGQLSWSGASTARSPGGGSTAGPGPCPAACDTPGWPRRSASAPRRRGPASRARERASAIRAPRRGVAPRRRRPPGIRAACRRATPEARGRRPSRCPWGIPGVGGSGRFGSGPGLRRPRPPGRGGRVPLRSGASAGRHPPPGSGIRQTSPRRPRARRFAPARRGPRTAATRPRSLSGSSHWAAWAYWRRLKALMPSIRRACPSRGEPAAAKGASSWRAWACRPSWYRVVARWNCSSGVKGRGVGKA